MVGVQVRQKNLADTRRPSCDSRSGTPRPQSKSSVSVPGLHQRTGLGAVEIERRASGSEERDSDRS